MAKFLTLNIGGKPTEIPLENDSPEGVAAAIKQAFPNSAAKFPTTADALEDVTTTPAAPVHVDPDGGGLSLTRLAKILTGTESIGQTVSKEVPNLRGQVIGAGLERFVEPFLRLNRPTGNDLGGLFGPEPTALSTASDALQAGTAVATPGLAAAGAGAQALTQFAGQSPETARAVGGATELLTSLAGVVKAGTSAAARGLGLIKTAPTAIKALPVAEDLLPMERVSTELNRALSGEFSRRSAQLGAEFDAVERAAVASEPVILPGTTAYDKLRDIVNYADDSVATFGGVGGQSMSRIAKAVNHVAEDGSALPQPIPTSELIRLRKGLKDLATRGRSFDPDIAANAKKAVHVRTEAGAALESVMDPATLERWRAANTAWGSTVAEPLSVLHQVIEDKSAYNAFRAVFQNQDPEVFRTVLRVAQQTPSVAGKLKLGFLEVLRENTNTFQDAGRFRAIFDQVKPMVESAGLFNREELTALDTFIRRKSIIPVTSAIAQAFSSTSGVLRLGSGLAVASAITHNPTALFLAGAASGALPAMRRLTILPAGSPAAKKVALQIATQISTFAASISQDQAAPRQQGETATR